MFKKLLNAIITSILRYFYTFQIPKENRAFFVSPPIPYISQFVSIQPASISPKKNIEDKHLAKKFGAKNIQEFNFWCWRDCGIACVKMILSSFGKAKSKTMMDLTREGITLGGYTVFDENGKLVDEGWFHKPLAELLQKYKLNAVIKKWQSAESVLASVMKNKKVILSLWLPTREDIQEDGSFLPKKNARYCGHLVVVVGVNVKKGKIEGIYVHDPRGLKNYQENAFIPIKTFNKVFSGRTIEVW